MRKQERNLKYWSRVVEELLIYHKLAWRAQTASSQEELDEVLEEMQSHHDSVEARMMWETLPGF